MEQKQQGSLVVVGTGISVAGQFTSVAVNHIKQSDLVLAVIPNKSCFNFVEKLNKKVVSLDYLYASGKSRVVTYREMSAIVIEQVLAGKRVCLAFYGHPGVLAWAPHAAIKELKSLGYSAKMEPGISAVDCMIADIGIDPAAWGCQFQEATQFLVRKYSLDCYQTQIFLQIGIVGELSLTMYQPDRKNNGLAIFTDKLLKYYSESKQVILYEAAEFPFSNSVIKKLTIKDLPDSEPTDKSTLVIPGEELPDLDGDVLTQLCSNQESYKKSLSG